MNNVISPPARAALLTLLAALVLASPSSALAQDTKPAAPPESPTAQRPPDVEQPPTDAQPLDDPDLENLDIETPQADVAVAQEPGKGDEVTTEAVPAGESETSWFSSPLWVVLALLLVGLTVILVLSGRRRR